MPVGVREAGDGEDQAAKHARASRTITSVPTPRTVHLAMTRNEQPQLEQPLEVDVCGGRTQSRSLFFADAPGPYHGPRRTLKLGEVRQRSVRKHVTSEAIVAGLLDRLQETLELEGTLNVAARVAGITKFQAVLDTARPGGYTCTSLERRTLPFLGSDQDQN